jgi:cobalt transporter subunit CbtB
MTNTLTKTNIKTGLLPIVFTAVFGMTMVFVTGFAHSQTVHDAAHDMRHSTGFPCH